MFLNVIIPAYNASATIADTLKSVRANRATFSGEFDITVVNSSHPTEDTTPEIIRSLDFDVNFVQLPKRAYPGAARNRGVEATKGDVICFIDSDAVADGNWLVSINNYLKNNPDVAAVGGPVLNANPDDGFSPLAHWCEFSGYGPHAPEGVRRVQPTVNVAIRREVFEKCGPFLEDQFGNEDVLLFSRMKEAGEMLHFSRDVRVFHRNKTKLSDIYAHQFRLGECTGRARVLYDLPGSFLTRPGGSFLLPIIKTHFIGWRIFTEEFDEYLRYDLNSLRVFMAMCHFARGFKEGVKIAMEEKE